jgi:amino acid adenylation domain-containing protein/non-ribosomal peptide synthase protein (TIGR01720 family)
MIGTDRSVFDVQARTLVDLLRERGRTDPAQLAYRFLSGDDAESKQITYGELNERSQSIAAVLHDLGARGERALLLYPPGFDYVAAFFGCLYAGVIAVPVYSHRANRTQRLQLIAADAQARFALTTNRILETIDPQTELNWLATDSIATDAHFQFKETESPDEDALAYLQYTSGSTAAPKGVMITHRNVLANSAYIHYGFAHTRESVSLCWLPHFHDMGLVDGIIQPLYGGFPGLLMSPASFLQRPLSWLEAISKYRVTHSGGPNFAYDLCVRRTNEEQRAALDLSHWRVAYNGAEPVRNETLNSFADAFAISGFRRSCFYPAYGLAEATLKVSGGHPADAPVTCTLSSSALEQNRVVVTETGDSTLVSSGQSALATEVRIVHPETLTVCARDEVGEIWVSGPGVAKGYWQRPEETEHTFNAYVAGDGPFLRTGDLGFIREGALFVTGRIKDLIIIRGRNHYPQDIELTAAHSNPALRTGNGAAFSVAMSGEEQLVLAQEVDVRQQADWQSVIADVRAAILEEFEIQPAAILLLKPGDIPKTSSGKVQRSTARAKFLSNGWEVVAEWRGGQAQDTLELDAPESTSAASLETWLQKSIAAMLKVSPTEIDCDHSLARLGVDSLMSLELIHAIEAGLGVVLPLAEFLESPSVKQLAARAAEELAAGQRSVAPVAPAEQPGRYPLSENQKALWFLHHIAPESTAYNVSFAGRMRGDVDTEALRRAFASLVARHASLRTSFDSGAGEPQQRVHEQPELFFQVEDASLWTESQLRERLSFEAQFSFDLARPPLLRFFVFKRAEAEQVLLLVAHHIIVDFWSLSVLMRELSTLYRAETSNTPVALDSSSREYADYVKWQQAMLESAEAAPQQSFWERELSGELPIIDLPADHPRPAVQSYRGATFSLRLDGELSSELKSLAQLHDSTLYMTLLAAFDVLVYRHTRQRDLLIGSPASGRSSALFSDTVGYFVNPIVTRTKLSGRMTFTQLLAQVRRTVLAAFAHQDYPFNLLVRRLQPERDSARSPLFQIMFALQKAHRSDEQALAAFALGEAGVSMDFGGLLLESMALDQRIAQFDLALTMAELHGGLTASFEYCTDLFDESTIRRLADHFHVLLKEIVADPSRRLDDFALITRAENEQLLNEWNGVAQIPAVQSVHHSFELQAAANPNQIAVLSGSEQLTYGELNARSNQLARFLRARGVGPNIIVGLCVGRSIEMLVGLLGILKAGATYVPLDPLYPQQRLAFMVEDAAASFLVTTQKASSSLPPHSAQKILLDEDWPAIARESDAVLEVEPDSNSLAYIIYTSGSTGVPKGTAITHGALAHYISAVTEEWGITDRDRVLQFASFSFDVSFEEIFSCLTRGATLVLRDDEMPSSTAALLRACRKQRLTVLNLPTAYWHQLAATLTPADWTNAETVRLVIIGSEKLQPERLVQWQSIVGPHVRLVDVYGPTETTIGATMCDLTHVNGTGRVSIGRPLRHAQAYVLDDGLQPAPVGVAGELHIGGLGLSPGYLNHPALTAEKFIPHPFSNVPGARLYQTGDLARFLPDGSVEFLGRRDEQVKVRGFRIELGEIERALLRHDHVRDAVVSLNGTQDEKRVIAYVVASDHEALNTHDLRDHLKSRLPEYMLPSTFVFLESLPLGPTGKVDYRALPVPDKSRPELMSAFVAPRTELEQLLAGIWADVLKLQRVGLHDNFFELGGDSILTIQVVARAQQMGLNLTARQMFKHPTVAELSLVAGALPREKAEQGAVSGEVPLTPIQRWFFSQEFEVKDYWNMAVLLEVREQVQPPLLEEALALLVAHHDALRTRFIREPGGWRQFVPESVAEQPQLRLVDLSDVTEQTAAIEAIARETQTQLNLAVGPLLKAVLFELGNDRAPRLLLVVHHLVIDGVSWTILLDDLTRLYTQLKQAEPPALPLKTTSFKSWAEHLERHGLAPDALHYWTKLATKQLKSLPVDHPDGSNREASTRVVSMSLSADETRSLLQEVPSVYHTQINDVLLTALASAFAQWTGQSELFLELESHGREELYNGVDLSRTVGWFTSAFPVLLELDRSLTPGQALQSIKEQLRAIPDNGINYGIARYLHDAATSLRSLPQPDVTFNYLGQLDQMLESASIFALAREPISLTRAERNHRTHLLEINAGVYDGELRLDWSYSAELHDHATIERLAANHVQSLRKIIAHCLSPGAGGYSSSDFPLAKLSQRQLDDLLKTTGPVTDIYPLSAMQQGMLFYSLDTETGMYIEQLSCSLNVDLNVAVFSEAWQHVVERHAILRTSFVWEEVDEPLQVVHPHVSLPIVERDLRGLAPADQERLLNEFSSEERSHAFELDQAPLMRLALLRTADDCYRFIWTHHHILLDGWSAALVLHEVVTAYEALAHGGELPAPVQRPFRDYVAWLQKQDVAKAERFWRAELKGFTRPLVLAAGWPAKSDRHNESGSVELRLSSEETSALQAFARRHHLTMSTLVHGAFALLLSRYTTEADVVFGTTVSGRPPVLPEVGSMVGLFINTLPVRVPVSPEESALSWLERLQAKLVGMRDYEYSPLVDVQSWSEVPRRQDLFETLLVFENHPVDATLLDSKQRLRLGDVRSFEHINYPLAIMVFPRAELVLQGLYLPERYGGETIRRVLGHLKNLLLEIIANPTQRLAGMHLMSKAERGLLEQWNHTAKPYESDRCIHQVFEAVAERYPDALAVMAKDRSLTFEALNRRANQLARYLRKQGVGPDVPVALCVDRSPEMIVALIGILKAGGAYVPLDPSYPAERLCFMVADINGPVLLTQQSLAGLFAATSTRIVCLDNEWKSIAEEPDDNLNSSATADNLAYLIYTSGSTGLPKGVAVTHASVVNLVEWYKHAFAVTPGDRSTFVAGVGFDASVMEVWSNLAAGATLYLADDETRLSPILMRDWVLEHQINVCFLPTPLAEMAIQLEWPADTVLRVMLTGGDKLRHYPDASLPFELVNIYGPTEATVLATSERLKSEGNGDEPSIGRPIDNVRIHLLDRKFSPVPVGVAGEVFVQGTGLARGYWRRPDLTAQSFIPDPWSTSPGARMYRTGDMARYYADGSIEFLGRIDNQIKLRGFRIELGEIEAALSAHEAVQAAVVLVSEDQFGEKRLVAYLVPNGTELSASIGELRASLRQRLPEYMVPATFVVLEEFPLTPNGKVDRRALAAMDGAQPEPDADFVAPRNAIEEALVDIWRGVLGVERVGVNDNFFELGGHSLMVTRVLSKVRAVFRIELPLRVVFECGTVAELAVAILPFESQPGRTEKIAKVLQKVKGISAEDLSKELEKKRREKGLN